jgi:hypothetical protein
MNNFQLLVKEFLKENAAGNVAGSGGALGTYSSSQFSGPNLYAPGDNRNVTDSAFPIADYGKPKRRRKHKKGRKIKNKKKITKKSKRPLVVRRTLQRNLM